MLEPEKAFTLFPNSATHYLTVNLLFEVNGEINLRVFDSMGKIIQATKTNDVSTEFNLSHYADGMYFLQVQTKDKIGTKKFVVKK